MADPFILSQVRRLPLFTYLSPEQAEVVAGAFQQKRYRPGDRLYRQGDNVQALYVFVSGGGVVLYTGADGAEQQQGTLGPGQFVGEDRISFVECGLGCVQQAAHLGVLSRGRIWGLGPGSRGTGARALAVLDALGESDSGLA